jgi:hypothetical protein
MTTEQVAVLRIASYILVCAAAAALLGRATRNVSFIPISLRAAVASLVISWTPMPIPQSRIAYVMESSASVFVRYLMKKTYVIESHFYAFAAMATLSLALLAYWHFALPKFKKQGDAQ